MIIKPEKELILRTINKYIMEIIENGLRHGFGTYYFISRDRY